MDIYVLTETDTYDNTSFVWGVFESLEVMNKVWRASHLRDAIDESFVFSLDKSRYDINIGSGYRSIFEYELMELNCEN